MLIIPAIDLRGGKCVRLTQGDFNQENVYDADPAAIARGFEREGAEWLHVVDLDGAKSGAPANVPSLLQIRRAVSIRIEYGGGVRSIDAAKKLLLCGIDRVVLGTSLVADESLAARVFGELGDRIVAGLDSRKGKLAISGWRGDSAVDAVDLARKLQAFGASRFVVTDIARDGTLEGPNLIYLSEFLDQVDAAVIASGGVSSLEDLMKLASLGRRNLEGVIVGKALYEGKFQLSQALGLDLK